MVIHLWNQEYQVYETWQHLTDNIHKAYDKEKKWMNYTRAGLVVMRSIMISSNPTWKRSMRLTRGWIWFIMLIFKVVLVLPSIVHCYCCFHKGGMTSEHVEIANLILDISVRMIMLGYRRDFNPKNCHFKDARDNLPLSLLRQCIARMNNTIDSENHWQVSKSRWRKLWQTIWNDLTPYQHMTDHFGDANRGHWDNDQKAS